MINEIKLLPEFLANQIAAGEVVQRPESVVKELVENAVDAGATHIAVVVKNSGKQLIHIVDNGNGMSKDDLKMSIKRHATSKISTQEDLERIMSYGFRGEALASISAVAQLEIRTKLDGEKLGWKLISEPNKEDTITPENTEKGTQIFVKNLFYNVPARRKFLRANITEFRYISDTMMKFALSHPHLRFTFYDGDNLIFDVHPSPLEERISHLMGNTVSGSLIKVHFENDFIKILGYVGQPHLARNSSSGQHLFLNTRAIQSKALSHAIYSSFEHLLEKNHKPLFIINMEIDPEQIDINVHPQKHEVKFEDERLIYNTLRKAVTMGLQEYDLTPEIELIRHQVNNPFEQSKDEQSGENFLINKITGEVIENTPVRSFEQRQANFTERYNPKNYPNGNNNLFANVQPPNKERTEEESAFDALFNTGKRKEAAPLSPTIGDELSNNTNKYWQLHNKYILMHTEQGMLIIDQHNAHERVLFEKAIKMMNKEFRSSQTLLFPVSINLSPSQKALIEEIKPELYDIGFDLEIENNRAIIKAIPTDISNGSEENALMEIISEYEENQKIKHTEKRENIAASFSCKSAIKTGKKLSFEEMKALATDIFKCDMPYVCPHGRPVILDFTLKELDRKFGRTS